MSGQARDEIISSAVKKFLLLNFTAGQMLSILSGNKDM